MRQIFRRILVYARNRTRPLGYFSYIDGTISGAEYMNIRTRVQIESINKIRNDWDSILQHLSMYHILDRHISHYLLSKGYIGKIQVFEIRVWRILFYILDLFAFLAPFQHVFTLRVEESGKLDSKKVIYVLTKGKKREDLYSQSSTYRVRDLYISKIASADTGNSHSVTFAERLKHLWVKLKYYYVKSDILVELLGMKVLIDRDFKEIKQKANIVASLSREGCTHGVRMLFWVSRLNQVPSITVFTTSQMEPKFYIYSEYTALLSDQHAMDFSYFPGYRGSFVFRDHPFFEWRELSKYRSPLVRIGYCPDLGFLGIKQKQENDMKILSLVRSVSSNPISIRPHPQEWESKESMAHYQSMLEAYSNCELDRKLSVVDFLKDIKVLVVSAETTVTEEALLMSIPVIIVCGDDTRYSGEYARRAGGLLKVCSTYADLPRALQELLDLSTEELQVRYRAFLASLNFSDNRRSSIDECISHFEMRSL